VSDDGRAAIVVIALLGNPFSPRYARAREREAALPLSFCAFNVAIYARRASAWCLTERCVAESERDASGLTIGESTMHWVGDNLVMEINERTAPFGRPVRGRITLRPEARTEARFELDSWGRHAWWPVAPLARVEVDLPCPGVRFDGHGYHDANSGSEPLETAFDSWQWTRARVGTSAVIVYDVRQTSGGSRSLALEVTSRGSVEPLEAKRTVRLPRTLWGLDRFVRADDGHSPRIVQSLEDGPFYSRAIVETWLQGRRLLAVQESLVARRLKRAWVRRLLGFRMRFER
jgi:carotenoid 1,2-hydratase